MKQLYQALHGARRYIREDATKCPCGNSLKSGGHGFCHTCCEATSLILKANGTSWKEETLRIWDNLMKRRRRNVSMF